MNEEQDKTYLELVEQSNFEMYAAIKRVRELHKPDEDLPHLCAAPDCNFALYPCGTIKALDGEQ